MAADGCTCGAHDGLQPQFKAELDQSLVVKRLARRNGTAKEISAARSLLRILRDNHELEESEPIIERPVMNMDEWTQEEVSRAAETRRGVRMGCTHCGPGPECIHVPGDSERPLSVFAARDSARDLMRALQRGEPPEWAHVLHGHMPTPPAGVHAYLQAVVRHGLTNGNAKVFANDRIPIPDEVRRFSSGSQTNAVRFRDAAVGSFFASLFHYIQGNSPAKVSLDPWDLTHGHMFAHTDTEAADHGEVPCDLGILYHGKEYPQEYAVYGAAGSSADPREKSVTSVVEHDFHWRNYLWLLSTNQVVLLDPSHPNFPEDLARNQFHTVDEYAFGKPTLGSINYFVGLFSNNRATGAYEIALTERDGVERVYQMGRRIDHMHGNTWHRWYAEQVTSHIAACPGSAMDVLMAPNNGMPPDFKLMHATGPEMRQSIVAALDLGSLLELMPIIKAAPGACEERVRRLDAHREEIHGYADACMAILMEKKQRMYEGELAKLLALNVTMEDAKEALRVSTRPDSDSCSAFQAECLLKVCMPKYRSGDLLRDFPTEEHAWADGYRMLKEIHFTGIRPDLALMAFKLIEVENVPRREALQRCVKIMEKEEAEIWASFK